MNGAEKQVSHFFRRMGLGFLCLGLVTSGFAEAGEKAVKRRLAGEAADSPRLLLPLDVFDEPASNQGFSTQRVNYCPSDEGYVWGRLQGGSGVDESYAVATACGRVFLAGNAQGQLGANPGQGGTDIVVRSIKNDGQTEWLKHFGTSANDYAVAMALGPSAAGCTSTPLYVAGYTSGTLSGPPRSSSDADAFLIGYNSATQAELWRVQFGGSSNDYVYGAATDAAGNIYVVGATGSKLNTRQPPSGTTDMFVAKYTPGGARVWVHQAGVTGKFSAARGVAVGANGSVYVVGYTAGGLNGAPYKGGSYDLFVARYDNNGALLNTVLLGTAGAELGYGIAAASEAGNTVIYVTGQTDNAFPGTTSQGQFDIITAKYNDTLNTRLWLKQEGGPKNDYAYSIAYSAQTQEVSVGGSSETDFTTGLGLGSSDMLLVTYSPQGGRLFSEHLGGPAREVARALTTDAQGHVYLAGSSDGKLCGSTPDGDFTGGVLDSVVISFDNGCRINRNDPRCVTAGATGDPHYFTFDQLFYDFQGSGNFILARHESDPSFEIQARQCGIGSVAIFKGVGARIGGDRIELSPDGSVWLNDVLTPVLNPIVLSNGGRIYKLDAARHVFVWPTGERLLAYAYGNHIDLFVLSPKWRLGHYLGLLGNGDGSRDNEYTYRDGTPMQSILSFDEMYHSTDSLASQWRLDASVDTRLVNHGTDCTNLAFPLEYVSSSTLTPAQRSAGESACAGVTDPVLKDDCVLDVGVSGDAIFATNVVNLTDRLDKAGVSGVPVTKVRGVYFNNFTGQIGSEWDSITSNVTPAGGRLFLGEFGNQNVRLTLNNLGTHTRLKVSFDLLVINAWTGDDGFFGSPTVWKASADGSTLINATFSNWDGTFQSYPSPFMSAQSGARETDSLGYPYRDSVYRINLEFNHTSPDVALDLAAEGLSGILGESWGVTNFEVQGR